MAASDDLNDEFYGFSDTNDDSNESESNSITNTDSAKPIPLEPPPAHTFDTFDNLWAFFLKHCRTRGYGIRKGRTKVKKGITYKVWIQCDKAEKSSHREKSRDVGTKGVGCTFCCKAVLRADGLWHLEVNQPMHVDRNSKQCHSPSFHPSSHICHRKRTIDQLNTIDTMSKVKIAPKFIQAALRQADSLSLVTRKDIANDRGKLRRKHLQGMTPTQSLVRILQDNTQGWAFSYKTDGKGHVSALFFTHKDQIRFARTYFEVLLIDATYKTNRFNMPLVHFMGVIPVVERKVAQSGSNISLGFCFVSGECEFSYQWVIQTFKDLVYGDEVIPRVILRDGDPAVASAVTTVFPSVPQLLCFFHVCINVEEAIAKQWVTPTHSGLTQEQLDAIKEDRITALSRFKEVASCHTIDDFTTCFEKLCEDYAHQPKFVNYLRTQQSPKRKLVVKAWTSLVSHFGNSASSRLEGGHRTVKAFMDSSKGDLLDVFNILELHFQGEIMKLQKLLSDARERLQHSINPRNVPVFDTQLIDEVLPLGLKLVRKQYDLAMSENYIENCSGKWRTIYDLPCCHDIKKVKDVDAKLTAADFNSRWHFERVNRLLRVTTTVTTPILEPNVVKSKGRPRGSTNLTPRGLAGRGGGGTEPREPSSHEREQALQVQRDSELLANSLTGLQSATPVPTQDNGFQHIDDGELLSLTANLSPTSLTIDLTHTAVAVAARALEPSELVQQGTKRGRPALPAAEAALRRKESQRKAQENKKRRKGMTEAERDADVLKVKAESRAAKQRKA
jgi:hypothetical protein